MADNTLGLSPLTPVSIIDIDLNKAIEDRANLTNTTSPVLKQMELSFPLKKESDFAPANMFISNKELAPISGYNEFETDPTYNPMLSSMDNVRGYAGRQPTSEWWANNLMKFGITAKDSFINNFEQNSRNVNALRKWDASELFSQDSNTEQQEELRNLYPTYGTGELDNSWKRFIPTNFGKSDFGGEFFPQLGFTAGMLAETIVENAALAYITGGVGNAANAAKTAGTLGKIGKGLWTLFETANGITQFRRGVNILNTISKESSLFANTTKGLKALANGYAVLKTAESEGAFEANNNYTDHYNKLVDAYTLEKGFPPIGKDLEEIKKSALNTGLATMAINMPILLASNLTQFGNISKPFKGALAESVEKTAFEITGKGLSSSIKKVAEKQLKNNYAKIIQKSGKFLLEPFSEMGEEIGQSYGSTASSAYFENVYKGLSKGSPLNAAMQAMYDYTFSKSFWDDGVGGFYGGLLFKGVGAASSKLGWQERLGFETDKSKKIKQNKFVDDATKKLSSLNNQQIAQFLYNPNVQNFISQIAHKEKMAEAAENNDMFSFQDAKSDSVRDAIWRGLQTGKLDLVLSQIENLANLDEEDLVNIRTIQDEKDRVEAKQKALVVVEEVKQRAYSLQSKWNALNQKYPNTYAENTNMYSAFEFAKRDRLFALDQIEEDRKRGDKLRDRISFNSNAVINNNIIDQAIDQELLDKQITELTVTLENTIDKQSPLYAIQGKQLEILKKIAKEKESETPNYKEMAKLTYELATTNTTGKYIILDPEETITDIQDTLKIEARHIKNIQDYKILNKQALNPEQLTSILEEVIEQAAKDEAKKASPIVQTATSIAGTSSPSTEQIVITGNLEKDQELLQKLLENVKVTIVQKENKFDVILSTIKNNTSVKTTIKTYNSLEELFNDINFLRKNITPYKEEVVNILEKDEKEVKKLHEDAFEESKKEASIMAYTSSRPLWEEREIMPEHLYRDEYLFENFRLGLIKGNIKAIPVIPQNRELIETKLNLPKESLTFLIEEAISKDKEGNPVDYTFSETNLNGLVNFIYVREIEKDKYELIDQKGNPIVKDYQQNIVQSTYLTGDIDQLQKDKKFRSYYSEPVQQAIVDNIITFRKYLLSTEFTGFETFDFSISNGLPNETKNFSRQNVIKASLILPTNIDKNTIYIGTKETKRLNDETSRTTVAGRPYLQMEKVHPNGTKQMYYQYLDNNKLSEDEKTLIKKAIQQLQKDFENGGATFETLIKNKNYLLLRGMLQVTPIKQEKITLESGETFSYAKALPPSYNADLQINTNKQGKVNIYFKTEAGTITNITLEKEFNEWLDRRYHNINKPMLSSSSVFEINNITYPSYTHYLLGIIDKEGNLAETTPPLTVRIEASEGMPFIQKYAVYDFNKVKGIKEILHVKKVEVVKTQQPFVQKTATATPATATGEPARPLSNFEKMRMAAQKRAGEQPQPFEENKQSTATPATAAGEPARPLSNFEKMRMAAQKRAGEQPQSNPVNPAPQPSIVPTLKIGDTFTHKNKTYTITEITSTKIKGDNVTWTPAVFEKEYAAGNITINNNPSTTLPITEDFDPNSLIEEEESTDNIEIKPTEGTSVTPEQTLTNEEQNNADERELPQFQLERIAFNDISDIDIEEELKEHDRMLGQIKINFNPKLKRRFGNYAVWGSYKDGVINIYNGAKKGTTYHEDMEAVWNGILTKTQQETLINEFKSRQGVFIPWDSTTSINYQDASTYQAKEAIMDEFILYKEQNKYVAPTTLIGRFFEMLLNYINRFINTFFPTINKTYLNLNQGAYKNIKINKTFNEYFSLKDVGEVITFEFAKDFSSLMFAEMEKENITLLAGLDEGRYDAIVLYEKLKEKVNSIYNYKTAAEEKKALRFMGQRAAYMFNVEKKYKTKKEADIMASREFELAKKIWNEHINTTTDWADFVQVHKNLLRQLDFAFASDDVENKLEEQYKEEGGEENKSGKEYVPDPLSQNIKDKISRSIKILLATLPDTTYIKSSLTGQPIPILVPSPVTGLPMLNLNYTKLFNRLLDILSGYNDEMLIKKLEEFSTITEKEQSLIGTPLGNLKGQIKQLYNKILSQPESELNEKEFKLRMQFNAAFLNQKPKFIRQVNTEAGTTYFRDEKHETLSKETQKDALRNIRQDSFDNKSTHWLKYISKEAYSLNKKHSLFQAEIPGKDVQYIHEDTGKKFKPQPDEVVVPNGVISVKNYLLAEALENLGFTKFSRDILSSLKSDDLKIVKDNVNFIITILKDDIRENKKYTKITWGELRIDTYINKIAEVYASISADESNVMHPNVDNKSQSDYLESNFVNFLISDVNSLTKEEFYKKHPYYKNDSYCNNSIILDKLYAQKEAGGKHRLTIIGGISNVDGTGVPLTNVTESQYAMTRFNAALDFTQQPNQPRNKKAIYPLLENADGTLDWGIELGEYISNVHEIYIENSTKLSELQDIVRKQLTSEISFAIDFVHNEDSTRITSEILNTTTADGRKLGAGLQFMKPILINNSELLETIYEQIDTNLPVENIVTNVLKEVTEEFVNYTKAKAAKTREYLTTKHIIEPTDNGFKFHLIDDNYLFAKNEISNESIDELIFQREINYIINNMEMFKMFFGSPLYYKQGMKRFKSSLSPRTYTQNSEAINNGLTKLQNYSVIPVIDVTKNTVSRIQNEQLKDDDKFEIPETDATYHKYNQFFKIWSIADVKTFNKTLSKFFKKYEESESTDGQMMMILSYVKEMLYKNKVNWTEEQENQLQLSLAYQRIKLASKNKPNTKTKYYTYSSPELRERDIQILEPFITKKGSGYGNSEYNLPTFGYINIIKPIQSGFKYGNYQEPSLIKTSVLPLTYDMVEGTKLESLFLDMLENDVAGIAYNSAHKVGQETIVNGTLGNVISHTGETRLPSSVSQTELINWSSMGLQQETQTQKDAGTAGTQIMKHITGDLYLAGVPKDFIKGKKISYDLIKKWTELSEEQKIKQSDLYRLDQNHFKALSDLFLHNYQEFLDEFGITETSNGYSFPSDQLLKARLIESLQKLGTPIHVLEQVKSGLPLEVLPDYQMLKHMFFSLVDKNIASTKLNGGQKIEMSSALLDLLKNEKGEDNNYEIYYKKDKSKDEYKLLTDVSKFNSKIHKYVVTNTRLKFYEDTTTGTKRMQVMLSSRMKNKLNQYRSKKDLPLLNDKELLEYLQKNQTKLLEGIGFRIPTQAMNSIDAFEIIGFLPEYLGDAIAVPTELPTKVGSDFDVDKLNTYLFNYSINKEGYPVYIDFDEDASEAGIKRRYINRIKKVSEARAEKTIGTLSDYITTEAQDEFKQINEINKEAKKEYKTKKEELKQELFQENENPFFDLPKSIKQFYWLQEEAIQFDGLEKVSFYLAFNDVMINEVDKQVSIVNSPIREYSYINKKTKEKIYEKVDLRVVKNQMEALKEYYTTILNSAQNITIFKELKEKLYAALKEQQEDSYITKKEIAAGLIEKYNDIKFEHYKNIAQINNLISFNNFSKLSINIQNSKEAIQNRYFQSISDLLLRKENFKRLITPNSASEFEIGGSYLENKSLTDYVLSNKGINITTVDDLDLFLDSTEMVKSRYTYLAAKKNVGISAVAGTSHSHFQRFLSYIDLNYKEKGLWDLGDKEIKFDNNTIDVDGKSYSHISAIGSEDYNILEFCSKYVDGSVDAIKGSAWLGKYGMVRQTAPVIVLATKMQIDPYEIANLINHPLVKKYIEIKELINSNLITINQTLNRDLDRLYSDVDIFQYITSKFEITEELPNIDSLSKHKEIIRNQVVMGKEYSDPTPLYKLQNKQHIAIALETLRQFLLLKDLSSDLLNTINTGKHETMHWNSNVIYPVIDYNFNIDKKHSPFRAIYAKKEGDKTTIETGSSAEAIRETSFVGALETTIGNINKFANQELFLPLTPKIVQFSMGYLARKNPNKHLFVKNVDKIVKIFQNAPLNIITHSSSIDTQDLLTARPRMEDFANAFFTVGSDNYKRIISEKRKLARLHSTNDLLNGTHILDYFDVEVIPGSVGDTHPGYWYLKVNNKPSTSEPLSVNPFIFGINRLRTTRPELFSDLMLASLMQSGVDFNRNNITNFMPLDIFTKMSENLTNTNFAVTQEFFNIILDDYVANIQNVETDNPVIVKPKWSTLPVNINLEASAPQRIIFTKSMANHEIKKKGHAFNIVLFPDHSFRKKQEKDAKTKKVGWSKNRFVKPNWWTNKDYIVFSHKKGERWENITYKKTEVFIETETMDGDKVNFFVYQRLPNKGMGSVTKEHIVPNLFSTETDANSKNSVYKDYNEQIKLYTDEEIYERFQQLYASGKLITARNEQFPQPYIINNKSIKINNEKINDSLSQKDYTQKENNPLLEESTSNSSTPVVIPTQQKEILTEIKKPSPGVELLTDSGMTVEKANEFIDILSPIIKKSAERENQSNNSNYMFSFGKRWTRIIAARGYWKTKFDQEFKNNPAFAKAISESDGNIKKRMEVLNKYLGSQFNTQINPYNKGWSATGFNYGYDNLDAFGNPVEPMTTLQPITNYIESKLDIDLSNYNSVLANIYTEDQFIPPHRDTTEDINAKGYAIVVLNIGADGSISEIPSDYYNKTADKSKSRWKNLSVKNGGMYAFGVNGVDRFNFFHAINTDDFGKTTPTKPLILPDESQLKNYRITLTYRRVTDPKEDGAPLIPARKELVQSINKEQTVDKTQVQPKANIPQNLISGIESFGTIQEALPEIKKVLGANPHSIDMIEAGFRTRTTRSVGEMEKYNIRVGDIVKQFGTSADGTTKNILTRVTAIHLKGTPEFLGTWNKEGWIQEGIKAIEKFKDGAAAIEFELINKNILQTVNSGIDVSITKNLIFKTKANTQFNYELNTQTGEVVRKDKTGDKTNLGDSEIIKVYREYGLANNLEEKIYNGSSYFKVFNKIINTNVDTSKNIFIEDGNIKSLFEEKKPQTQVKQPQQFTFADGTKVSIPFKLNSQQEDALLKLEAFYNSGNNQITLAGYAGTGKTTIIGIFDKYLNKKYEIPFYSSPTHRANAVTKQKNPSAKVLTLHKLFGLGPQIKFEDGEYSLKDLQFAKKNKEKITKGALLIVDESSMVNDALYDFLESHKKTHNIKIIYVGDKGQLKPVKQNHISKVFDGAAQISLTIVERTGNNPILEESTNLRNGLPLSYTSQSKNDGSVTYLNEERELNQILGREFSAQQNMDDKLFIRVLSATNNEVKNINKQIRQLLFNTEKQLVVNDLLMGYSNFDVDYNTGEPLIINSGDYVVTEVTEGVKTISDINETFKGNYVSLQNLMSKESPTISVFIVNNNEPETKLIKFVNKIKELNKEAEFAQDGRTKAMLFKKAAELENKLAFMKELKDNKNNLIVKKTLDYGYAHTIHKSQGGTYTKTVILADTINAFKDDEELQQQLEYVAMSRATSEVYVFTQKPINNAQSSTDLKSPEGLPTINPNNIKKDNCI